MTKEQTTTYRAALKEARAAFDRASNRLLEISEESARLTREIAQLRRTITALAALCSEEPGFDDLGITEAVWEVMEKEEFEISTVGVVKELEKMGFDLSSQKNVAASVHAILSRLANQGKIDRVKIEDKPVTWRGPKYDPNAIQY